jgi:hypothetical protein
MAQVTARGFTLAQRNAAHAIASYLHKLGMEEKRAWREAVGLVQIVRRANKAADQHSGDRAEGIRP